MKYVLALFFILTIQTSFAQKISLLNQVEIDPKFSHQFLKLMISHVAQFKNPDYSEKEFLEDLVEINKNLKGYQQKSTKTFLLSELYNVLFDFDKNTMVDAKNIYISETNLALAEKKIKKSGELLSKFSYFLINDMIENYTPYKEDNYINNYLNTSSGKFKDPEKRKRISLLNKHVGPWIILFNRLSSKKFNQVSYQFIKNYFKTIKSLSAFFRFQKIGDEKGEIFIVKDSSVSELLQKLVQNKSEDQSELEQKETQNTAKKDVESITVDPEDGAAPKIEEIIEKLDQNKE